MYGQGSIRIPSGKKICMIIICLFYAVKNKTSAIDKKNIVEIFIRSNKIYIRFILLLLNIHSIDS